MSQATQPPPSTAPPAKRRRTNSDNANTPQSLSEVSSKTQTGNFLDRSDVIGNESPVSPIQLGVTFGDFPGVPVLETDLSATTFRPTPAFWYDDNQTPTRDRLERLSGVFEDDASPPTCDSGHGSSLETISSSGKDITEKGDQLRLNGDIVESSKLAPQAEGAVVYVGRKRRRRGPSVSLSNGALPCPAMSFAADFVSSANNAFLRESLLKIYHDSFENALSCWLTERTCPYSTKAEISLANDDGPDWNRMYHRVFRLDRLASSIRGRQLTFSEDKAVCKALNAVIFSFATQWGQSSECSKAKYPFDYSNPGIFTSKSANQSSSGVEFDRSLQLTAWNEARLALRDAGEVESFRLVLAQIVFSLTQRPNKHDGEGQREVAVDTNSASTPHIADDGVVECEDLMSRLNLVIDAEDHPAHLEKGVRLIHSLRSRMTLCASTSTLKPRGNRRGKQYRLSANRVDAADRATVDLLFWLGVMFDTLSAAIHKRPLVLSDEDSNIYANEPRSATDQVPHDIGSAVARSIEGVWDAHLFARQRTRLQQDLVRWPCSFEQAAALLCDAAPMKVLLFRKVTRIQTLLARTYRGERVERSIKAALSVCDHWERLYAPFIRDCVQHHDTLPSRIWSWYLCLTGHWYLATLLLMDLIETVDDSDFGLEVQQTQRSSTDFVGFFRDANCQALSDLARCVCSREDVLFAQSRDFNISVNQEGLLTEPWTAVLVRAFAKAVVVLLESESTLPSFPLEDISEAERTFQRADDCIQALWLLGRKSDMALSAARILGDALRQKRKGVEEKSKDMTSYLGIEMWQGFEHLGEPVGWNCTP